MEPAIILTVLLIFAKESEVVAQRVDLLKQFTPTLCATSYFQPGGQFTIPASITPIISSAASTSTTAPSTAASSTAAPTTASPAISSSTDSGSYASTPQAISLPPVNIGGNNDFWQNLLYYLILAIAKNKSGAGDCSYPNVNSCYGGSSGCCGYGCGGNSYDGCGCGGYGCDYCGCGGYGCGCGYGEICAYDSVIINGATDSNNSGNNVNSGGYNANNSGNNANNNGNSASNYGYGCGCGGYGCSGVCGCGYGGICAYDSVTINGGTDVNNGGNNVNSGGNDVNSGGNNANNNGNNANNNGNSASNSGNCYGCGGYGCSGGCGCGYGGICAYDNIFNNAGTDVNIAGNNVIYIPYPIAIPTNCLFSCPSSLCPTNIPAKPEINQCPAPVAPPCICDYNDLQEINFIIRTECQSID